VLAKRLTFMGNAIKQNVCQVGSRIVAVSNDDAEKLDEVYRLRYRVYVTEMHRTEPLADHVRGWLRDEYDNVATILAAIDGDNVIGTLSFVHGSKLRGEDRSFWRLRAAGEDNLGQTCVVTKLTIEKPYRRSTHAARLVVEGFRLIYTAGLRYVFIDVNAPTHIFMQKLGFEQLGPMSMHKRYGHVYIMVLRMANWERLRAMRSPFCNVLANLEYDPAAAEVALEDMERGLD